MIEPHGDVPAPMPCMEQRQAIERLLEVRELLSEIDAEIDRERCIRLLDRLEETLTSQTATQQ